MLSQVEVINSPKKITMSDADGNFDFTKANDICIYSKHQLRSFTVNPLLFTNDELMSS
jgi:hypothetical protein